MQLDGWIPIALWLGLGAVVALYLYRRMDMEGKVVRAWLIAGLLLSVLGLILFLTFRSMKEKGRDKAVDPKAYKPPEYRMKAAEESPKTERPAEEPKPEPKKKDVKQIDGIPRCPECGAAISSSDKNCNDCGAKLKD
jgi:hypothetical protein